MVKFNSKKNFAMQYQKSHLTEYHDIKNGEGKALRKPDILVKRNKYKSK